MSMDEDEAPAASPRQGGAGEAPDDADHADGKSVNVHGADTEVSLGPRFLPCTGALSESRWIAGRLHQAAGFLCPFRAIPRVSPSGTLVGCMLSLNYALYYANTDVRNPTVGDIFRLPPLPLGPQVLGRRHAEARSARKPEARSSMRMRLEGAECCVISGRLGMTV